MYPPYSRRAFPSLGGGGSRQSAPPKKKARSARGNYIFIKPKETWTHDFCLLANPKDTKTPSLTTLVTLKEAGLGKKKVTFDDKRCGHGKCRQVLETVFPKLKTQCGAYEMLRADRGGVNCNLKLIEMSSQGYNLQHLKESVGATTIIYIRPMQSSLSMSKCISQTDDSIKSKCRYCLREIPLGDMKNHLENCMAGAGSSSMKDPIHEEELSDSSDEDDSVAENAFDFSKFLQGQSQKEEWKKTLRSMFPLHDPKQIDVSLIGVSSIEDAITELLDSSPDSQSCQKPEKSKVSKSHKSFSNDFPVDNLSLSMLLKEFRDHNSNAGIEALSVKRGSLWLDMLKFYKRKMSDARSLAKTLEVSFVDEEGLDGGALKVEFFNLAWDEVKKRLFTGNGISLLPIKDTTKLFLFRVAGTLLVHTVIQDGPVTMLPKLAKAILFSMLGKDVSDINLQLSKHDIPLSARTENIHCLIEELDDASSDIQVHSILEESQKSEAYWQIINASHWPMTEAITLKNKNNLILELIYNETVRTRFDVMNEFKKGLETLGFFSFLSKHQDQFIELFQCNSKPIGPEEFKALLQIETPNNHAEQQACNWFQEFIADGKVTLSKDDEISKIEALLEFVTSWRTLEKGTTKKIKVEFLADDDEKTLPMASACLWIIRLPTVHSSKQSFDAALLTALRHARHGFPNA